MMRRAVILFVLVAVFLIALAFLAAASNPHDDDRLPPQPVRPPTTLFA